MSRPRLRVLDLFAGRGGFSRAFRERGHLVVTLDIVPPADVLADARHLPFRPGTVFDVLLASPPCLEFSRWSMPWKRRKLPAGWAPSLELVQATRDAVQLFRPRWWVLENVRGARDFMPLPTWRVGSRYLWGRFPPLLAFTDGRDVFTKERIGPHAKDRPRVRAEIPYRLSLTLCEAMERAA